MTLLFRLGIGHNVFVVHIQKSIQYCQTIAFFSKLCGLWKWPLDFFLGAGKLLFQPRLLGFNFLDIRLNSVCQIGNAGKITQYIIAQFGGISTCTNQLYTEHIAKHGMRNLQCQPFVIADRYRLFGIKSNSQQAEQRFTGWLFFGVGFLHQLHGKNVFAFCILVGMRLHGSGIRRQVHNQFFAALNLLRESHGDFVFKVIDLSDIRPPEIEIELEKEIEIEKEREGETGHPAPAAYGRYNNVILTDTELSGLKTELPDKWEYYIDRLSCHIASTGKQYHSHAATIYKWAQEDAAKGKAAPKQGIPDYSCKEGESL